MASRSGATLAFQLLPMLLITPTAESHDPTASSGSNVSCNGVKIRLMGGFEKALIKRLSDSFVAETGADLQLTMNQADEFDKTQADIDGDIEHGHKWGYNFDVYFFQNGRWTNFANQDKFQEISDLVQNSPDMEWSDVFLRAREATSVFNSKVYGVPVDADVILMAYRKDIFQQAGLSPPKSWTEYVEVAKKLQEGGYAKYGTCIPDKLKDISAELFWAFMAPWLQSLGTETGMWFDPETMEPKINSDAAKEALKMYRELQKYSQSQKLNHGIPEDPTAGETKLKYGQENRYGYLEQMNAWSRGECAMLFNYPGPIKLFIADLAKVHIANVSGTVVTTAEAHGFAGNPFVGNNDMRVHYYAADGTPLTRQGPSGSSAVANSTTFFAKVTGDRTMVLFDSAADLQADTNAVSFDAGTGANTRLKTFNFGDQVGIDLLPGAKTVLAEDGTSAIPCTSSQCPFTSRGQGSDFNAGINTAPYYAGGGQSMFIRAGLPEEVKQCAFKLLVHFSKKENSLSIVASGEALLDPFRNKHFPDFSKKGTPAYTDIWNIWKQFDWTEVQLQQYKDVTNGAWNHQNGAFDIRIAGYEDYVRAPDRFLQGWLAGDLTDEQLIEGLTAQMRQATNKHGLDKQRDLYRGVLGLAPYNTLGTTTTEDGLPEWVLPVIAAVVGAALLSFLAFHAVKFYRTKVRLQREHEASIMKMVESGKKAVSNLGFPMVLISASNLLNMDIGELRTMHEGLRNTGKLLFLDVSEAVWKFKEAGSVIMFFSYQWLSWDVAGPDEAQWRCMREAVMEYANQTKVELDELFIWLDIISIPQGHNDLKTLAVNSLYVYASSANVMVIICPESKHKNTFEAAHTDSYKDRVWCRAEQTAYHCASPKNVLYLKSDRRDMKPVEPEWISSIVKIFSGKMTCCRLQHPGGKPCDRLSLIPVLMGLFYKIHLERNLCDPGKNAIWELIGADKANIFPDTFQYTKEDGSVETRDLFKGLLSRVEKKADGDVDLVALTHKCSKDEALNIVLSTLSSGTRISTVPSGPHAASHGQMQPAKSDTTAHSSHVVLVPRASPNQLAFSKVVPSQPIKDAWTEEVLI